MSRPFTTPSIFTAETPLPTQLYRKPTKIEKDRVKRPRASKPKVKSGCITCKARRVKCDEKKPECERCQRFGRKCDGYTPEPTPRPSTVVPIQPRLPPPIFRSPNITIHESEEERRYFQYFCDYTALELAGYNDPTFWTNLIVQEAHVLVPVRYAAIAIGALNKSLATASACEGKVVDLQTVDQKHHQFAVTHYIKAIQALNHHISVSNGPQLRTALIACILFACFETFEGSYLASQQQVNEGLKLLRSYYSGTPGSQGLLTTANASVTLNQFNNGHAILEGNHRLDGFATQFEDHLRLDKGGKFIPEQQVNVRKWENRSAPSVYATQLDTSLSTFNQKALYYRETSEHSSNSSNKSLNPLTTKIHDHQPRDLNGQSSERSSSESEPAPTNGVHISRDLPVASYITKHYGYTSDAQQLSWIPQPEGVGRLSSTISNSSTSSTDSLPSTGIQTINTSPQTFHYNLPHHSRAPTPPILYNDIPIEDIIIQTFVRLNGKCFLSGMMPRSLPLAWDIRNVFHLPIPKRFSSFTDAHRNWDFLGDRVHFFCRQTIFYRNNPSQERDDSNIISTYKSLIKSLTDFGAAFQPILDAAIEANCHIINPAAIVLSMHHKVTYVVLLAVASGSEMVYDSFLSTFRNVVRTASLLTSKHNTSNLPRNPRFSFDLGFIPPLHIVAMKCRDAVLRREAIELLIAHPRVEGMWDSLLVSRIDQWIMNIEEEGSSFGWQEHHLSSNPHTTQEGTNIPAAAFPRIDVHETIDQAFNYSSPPQPHTQIFKSGSPFYDGSPESPAAPRGDDLRHRDSACSLSRSEDRRRRNDGEMSNLYSATRSRHHSSAGVITPNSSAATLDPTFSSDLIYTRPKRHSTGTTEHCQSRESDVSSLSRLTAVTSANLLGATVIEPKIARMKGTKRMSFEDDNSTNQNSSKNIPPPTAQSRSSSSSRVRASLFENIRRESNSSGTHHTDWNFATENESQRLSKRRPSSRSHTSHITKETWTVPEYSRIQIRELDWHTSDRYVRVTCQRAVAKEDGTRKILETIISW